MRGKQKINKETNYQKAVRKPAARRRSSLKFA
jgi:hypothetical protein